MKSMFHAQLSSKQPFMILQSGSFAIEGVR